MFVESTEAKVFTPSIRRSVAIGSTATQIVLDKALTAAQIEYLKTEGATISIGSNKNLAVDVDALEEDAEVIVL